MTLTSPRTAAARVRLPRQDDVKTAVRWSLRQGIPLAGMKLGARRGDLFAQLNADPATQRDPFPFYDRVRTSGPLVPGGYVMATARHDVVFELLRSDQFRSGIPDEALPRTARRVLTWAEDPLAIPFTERPSMVVHNGADHLRIRRIASRAFTAKAIENLRTRTEQIADDLLDDIERRHHDGRVVDIVAEYASTLPVLVIADILGIPAELQPTFLRWGDCILQIASFGVPYRTFLEIEGGLREMNSWLLGHFEELRRNPGDNLLSKMVQASDDEHASGGGLSERELMQTAGLLLFAGFETTVNLIGSGTTRLLAHHDQWEILRAEPEHWRKTAIDEMLRLDGPVQFTVRSPAQDTEIHGVPVRRGRMVALLLAGANRDPAVFADPARFDVTRANARDHVALGAGVHFCLGASLARMEGEVALGRLFDRFPNLAAAGAPTLGPNAALRGYIHVPATLSKAYAGSSFGGFSGGGAPRG
ncbi:MAG TPA: cytochrome P450 [Sporichthya sp.]|nr:cytochrome P450 [Sporichthya sp.]